jgi:hypothetical protein
MCFPNTWAAGKLGKLSLAVPGRRLIAGVKLHRRGVRDLWRMNPFFKGATESLAARNLRSGAGEEYAKRRTNKAIWRTMAVGARDLRQRGLEWKFKARGELYQSD